MVTINHNIYNLGGKEVIYTNVLPGKKGETVKLNGLEREIANIQTGDDSFIVEFVPLFQK